MKTFYIIDGHAQLFRAYYAPFRPLSAPSGEPVKAVYIFTQMLLNILTKVRPDYLLVTFDVSDKTTFRADLFDEYKANRDATPEDLAPQFRRVRELIQALQIPILEVEGFEADDIIATLASQLRQEPIDIRIASKDKDLHQILSDRVALWDPSTGEIVDVDRLAEKLGYTPEQSLEMQVLMGDTVDNIPGAKGVGVKTAMRLIQKYGTAENVVDHADELTPKLRENILAHQNQMDLTRQLVLLRNDVPLIFDLEDAKTPEIQNDQVVPIFHELGFRTLIDQLPGGGQEELKILQDKQLDSQATKTEYHIVDDLSFDSFLYELNKQKVFAFDVETTGIPAVTADIVGLSFSWDEGTGWYVPVDGTDTDASRGEAYLRKLKPILESADSLKVGQNLKYDIIVLAEAGVVVGGAIFDTMVAAHLLHPERRTFNMDDLARDLLNYQTTPISELIGSGKHQVSMFDVELSKISRYAAEDADITWRLYKHLDNILRKMDDQTRELFDSVEMPLVRVLADMERVGIRLDSEMLKGLEISLAESIAELKQQIIISAGREFNPDSPKQLAEVLFDDLGFRVVKKTKTSRSTNAEVLDTLIAEVDHPLPGLILQYRERVKLLNTYVAPLPTYVKEKTSRVHASFHQTGTATGRLSSSDPNIQNIPIRSELGRAIRAAFIARDGYELLRADYSQVELRILAHYSEDVELVAAFEGGRDIHSFVASQVFNIPLSEVTGEQRNTAKTVNFGIIYGQTAFGLARTLKINQSEAAKFIETYNAQYPGIQKFLQQCVDQARDTGYVRTILGRRRKIDEVKSRNFNMRMLGERLAINTVIQGSAADLIKVAMVNVADKLSTEFPTSQLLIQVHDELVFEVPNDEIVLVQTMVKEIMESSIKLRVPLLVETAHGKSWISDD